MNDNLGRLRVGGVSRHHQHHFGDYLTSRGSITHGGYLHHNLTGDLRTREVLREVAGFLSRHSSYESTDGLGLARLHHIFGEQAMLKRAASLKSSYFPYKTPSFTVYNNSIFGAWHYWQATSDADAKKAIVGLADLVLADPDPTDINGRGFGAHQYNHGFVEALAYQLTQDKKYLTRLPQYFIYLDKTGRFSLCDLNGDMKAGARLLGWSALLKRVQACQLLMPERPYHLLGKVLNKWPFVMAVLPDESFLTVKSATLEKKTAPAKH